MAPEGDPPQGGGPSWEDTGAPGEPAWRDPPQPQPPAQDDPEAPKKWTPPADDQPPPPGSMRFQDPATARPRPPTVGEIRAREKAEREREEAERAQVEANVKRHRRNQRLKGGVAVVGVVGVVAALGYWALSPRTVNAQCVQEDSSGGPIVVPDSHCSGTSSGGPSGFFFYSGGHQYRYHYGSTGTVGSRPSGGTTVAPKGATVKTSSGSTIQRGGLGSKFSGSGGG